MASSLTTGLQSQCDLLRSLHRPGAPLLLPNAWDVATAKAVVAAGFPVVATTSGGVAATLGYEDEEGAPADEMLAAAARIARSVEVPVTVDAEAGYGMQPAELVAALRSAGTAGCNLEDTNHTTVAEAASVRAPKKTHAPAAFISSCTAATRALIISACSGEGGSAPSAWKTDSRYCGITGPGRGRRRGVVMVICGGLATSGPRPGT